MKPEELQRQGAYMKSLRNDRDMTLEDVEAKVVVNNSYLSQIERGIKRPGTDTLRKLSQCYGVPLNELLVRYKHTLPDEVPENKQEAIYRKMAEFKDKFNELQNLINGMYK
ncbi:MAG: helix-turn-helix domain-containing protein [Proteobacteria bacterium]|jgi:transcriptional regulator with XRE-family HTH domain|nr:helix-turn-helix domain-containing protein [Pseudomonadota bacterium]